MPCFQPFFHSAHFEQILIDILREILWWSTKFFMNYQELAGLQTIDLKQYTYASTRNVYETDVSYPNNS